MPIWHGSPRGMVRSSADPARHARILERRAARAQRSKWLGRLLFSLTGMGLLLALRMNPGIVEEAVAMAYGVPQAQSPAAEVPEDARVRQMPRDVVPVRRGGTLPQTTPSGDSTKHQADAVASTLRGLASGG